MKMLLMLYQNWSKMHWNDWLTEMNMKYRSSNIVLGSGILWWSVWTVAGNIPILEPWTLWEETNQKLWPQKLINPQKSTIIYNCVHKIRRFMRFSKYTAAPYKLYDFADRIAVRKQSLDYAVQMNDSIHTVRSILLWGLISLKCFSDRW